MRFLRTISTPRLIALCASAVAVAAGGTAIAVAGSSGPVPAPKPLAAAVHDGLTAPAVQGVTAQVTFTNHLIDSSGIHGASPLLSGATGRLWLSPGHGLRLELQSEGSTDSQVVVNQTGFWVYDGSSNTVYKGQLPADHGKESGAAAGKHQQDKVPSVAQIQSGIGRARSHKLNISGPVPGDIAGQPAYTVRVGPGEPGGLLGAVELGWDAAHGLPLRVAVYARGNNDPVLELVATDVQYGPVASHDLSISPPAGAKVVDVGGSSGAAGKAHARGKKGSRKGQPEVTGRAAVARNLPFTLSAPDTLANLKRSNVRLLSLKKGKAALVTYGSGPGTVAVVERAADPAKKAAAPQPQSGDHHGQLELPTVSVNGASARVIDTPLGSVVSFDRAGVSYTVLGSVPAAVAESVARGL